MASSHFSVYKYVCVSQNKSVLNWLKCVSYSITQVKSQLDENESRGKIQTTKKIIDSC